MHIFGGSSIQSNTVAKVVYNVILLLLLLSHFSRVRLCCDPKDGSPAGSLVPGILQARTLEWVAISFSNAWKWKVKVKCESEVAQSCPTISDPMDCSLPGSSVHGIFQARVLEWGAIAFKGGVNLCIWGYWYFSQQSWFQLVFHPAQHFSWCRQWHPTPVLLPGKSHGQRSLVGCSPWGR